LNTLQQQQQQQQQQKSSSKQTSAQLNDTVDCMTTPKCSPKASQKRHKKAWRNPSNGT
jgi:hypothetical protein